MADTYEVKVTVGDATVEVKGAQEGVVAIVEKLADVLSSRAGSSSPSAELVREEPGRRQRAVDVRTFFQSKSPSSQVEAVTVAAYYLAELTPEEARSETITAELAGRVFRQARFRLPSRMAQVLVNAQAAGYLDRVGSGEYRLNPVGYNLVEHSLGANG